MDSDLAEGTPLAAVPLWLRWLLLVPVSIIAALGAGALIKLTELLFTADPHSGLVVAIDTLASAALGAVFVYTAALLAPRKQFAIAVTAFVMLAGFALLSFVAVLKYAEVVSRREVTLHCIAIVIAGAIALYLIRKVEWE
jgi:hypothetical protein